MDILRQNLSRAFKFLRIVLNPGIEVKMALMFPLTFESKELVKSRINKGADELYEDMEAVHELERFFERVVKKEMNRFD